MDVLHSHPTEGTAFGIWKNLSSRKSRHNCLFDGYGALFVVRFDGRRNWIVHFGRAVLLHRPSILKYRHANGSTVDYTYENTTSRLHSVTDALGQTKQYSYAEDNRLTGIDYPNAVNPTPNVAFAYDPYFPRLVSMTDGTGTTTYAYVPVGMPGALRLQEEIGPLANDTISYAYDDLGRLVTRTVAGAGAETFEYDAIGRLVTHASDLGAFTLSYLGQTGQITERQLANSTLATSWSYLGFRGPLFHNTR
jgi:YD repeat-containing protein